jgi:hypothetical protein
LAFSILAIIDWESWFPACLIAPLPAEGDKEYCIENWEDYFPENTNNNLNGEFWWWLHNIFSQITNKN